jgi:hypothetical protein
MIESAPAVSDRVPGMRLLTRSWRRFRRRPASTQIRTTVMVIAVIAGLCVWVGTAPRASATTAATPESTASTSSRGVSAHSINVAFPVVSLSSLSGKFGFASDPEYGQQVTAIHVFVNAINKSGGINGRKINPIIDMYDPTDETAMRALCEDWTEGSPPIFAVLDGLGTMEGDNTLCVTQEGHTPMLTEWTTSSNYLSMGSPYLWWIGPDQSAIIKATVDWGLSAGLIGGTKKVGIIVGDRASDQLALHDDLLPDLKAAHIIPYLEEIAADPSETATTSAEAPDVIEKLKADGVQSVIPLIPFNVFYPILAAESQQQYDPRLLLSDYESSIESALGLIPVPYEAELNGQEGVTVQTIGGSGPGNKSFADGGYSPGELACYNIWHKAHPKPIPGLSTPTPLIEEQGPIAGWCGAIELFAEAAKKAGPDLNRRTFVEAMASIKNFPGTFTPTLSFGPEKFAGPTEYEVVKIHNNVPPSKACELTVAKNGKDTQAQGTCWVTVDTWKPLPSAP